LITPAAKHAQVFYLTIKTQPQWQKITSGAKALSFQKSTAKIAENTLKKFVKTRGIAAMRRRKIR
jgi:hypothetical protein